MKQEKILDSIRRSVNNCTPDVYEKVRNAPVQKMVTFDSITMQSVPRPKQGTKLQALSFRWAPVFAVMLLAVIVYGGWWSVFRADSVIGLDVNPSIEIKVNHFDRVLNLIPLNSDAFPIVEGIAYKQIKVESVLRAVIGSMYHHGYLNDPESAILVSVENQNHETASRLKDLVVIEVGDLISLAPQQIYSQTIDSELVKETAEKFGVSRGVMNLAYRARFNHPYLNFEDLVKLPIAQLYELATYKSDDPYWNEQGHPFGEDDLVDIRRQGPVEVFLPILFHSDSSSEQNSSSPIYEDNDDYDWWDDDDEWDD